jgi:hypothetical protein
MSLLQVKRDDPMLRIFNFINETTTLHLRGIIREPKQKRLYWLGISIMSDLLYSCDLRKTFPKTKSIIFLGDMNLLQRLEFTVVVHIMIV